MLCYLTHFIITDNLFLGTSCSLLDPEDWLTESPENTHPADFPSNEQPLADTSAASHNLPASSSMTDTEQNILGSAAENSVPEEPHELDTEAMEILGENPTSQIEYGKDIRSELASRLQHLLQEGLNKETKKALIAKYPLPANCIYIGAPKINPEIKAALPDAAIKRDKGIEAKQIPRASAVSCLGEIITSQLNSKERDNDLLQKLMDVIRLLADSQHHDSATRRNYILSTLKKEMRDHLTTTKIDTFLFGENLAETLKSAKAVKKSGVELKADDKPQPKKDNTTASKNRRAPAPVRRHPGATSRSRGPAAQRAPAPPPQQAYSYYRTAWPTAPLPPPPPPPPLPPPPPPQQRPTGRRRY